MSPEPLLSWRSWPFVERPKTSVLLIAFLALLAWFLWNLAVVQWQLPWFYFLGMILVLGNLLPYFIPTVYNLYEYEIVIHYLFLKVSRRYTDFGCFYSDKRGVMLSTFKLPRRLDVFRGQSLRYSKSQAEKEQLIEILGRKVGKQY
ncbi:MAG: hypothetical protein WCY21_05040 [Candidatus Cloacimonadaceae bacterium]|jgi:hypothetical protein|nr:hypothetical protein [Candidatus Cloacimonadota bacterium]MDX9949597.1 hypothetical protein [Candidatus Syntrophosphaera sp.]NLN85507.1 hypothetical protein [Candidatus Cloacimonadota bacterium]